MSKAAKKGTGILSGTKVLVGDNDLKSFLTEKGYGEAGKRHELSLIEALYLMETDKLEVYSADKELNFEAMLKIGGKIEKDLYSKYKVYADLRNRGLLVRTGLKFGCDYRVYDRGSNVKTSHSKYLVHVVPEEYNCSYPELARGIRLAENVNKAMIYAIVDEEGDITYYQMGRIRL